MKRLVLLGEGHGEVLALPVLVKRLLKERDARQLLFVDSHVIRTNPARLVKWDRKINQSDYSEWISRITLAARRPDVGGILAVYDGDMLMFPAGSKTPFCAATAAKEMATAAMTSGICRSLSLAVVFACCEYETWLVAGVESLVGPRLKDGRTIPRHLKFPTGRPESHGKGWLERNLPSYRPIRDQSALTELVGFQYIRGKKLRSFSRLEHAVDQLLEAVAKDAHSATP